MEKNTVRLHLQLGIINDAGFLEKNIAVFFL